MEPGKPIHIYNSYENSDLVNYNGQIIVCKGLRFNNQFQIMLGYEEHYLIDQSFILLNDKYEQCKTIERYKVIDNDVLEELKKYYKEETDVVVYYEKTPGVLGQFSIVDDQLYLNTAHILFNMPMSEFIDGTGKLKPVCYY